MTNMWGIACDTMCWVYDASIQLLEVDRNGSTEVVAMLSTGDPALPRPTAANTFDKSIKKIRLK